MKKHRTLFFFISAILLTFALVLGLILMPDMSPSLADSVPEHPPKLNPAINSETEVLNAISVDKTNVKSIISAISRPKEYFSETKSTLSHSGGSAEYIRKKWVRENLSRVDVISPTAEQTVLTHYVYSPTTVYIWKPGDTIHYNTARGDFDADDTQMLMSYEDILNASDENIVTAQNTLYDGVLCIYAEIKKPESGYTERYWVSTSTGLLLHGQTLNKEGSVIYSISSTRIDISPQDISLFNLPDGSTPTV
ncbi:MAG: hypothetical protein E7473_09565 [Ruminococcaceae bacterium]|nr:hypothetical protein [Oscillospiraceae bacterium]MBQ7119049.1 hypothetical protein [Oscillospiraceae bacterium]